MNNPEKKSKKEKKGKEKECRHSQRPLPQNGWPGLICCKCGKLFLYPRY